MEQNLYSQVIRIRQTDLNFLQQIRTKIKLNLSFNVNMQDHKDGLILT